MLVERQTSERWKQILVSTICLHYPPNRLCFHFISVYNQWAPTTEAEAVSRYLLQLVRKMMQTLFGQLEMLNVLIERAARESRFSVVTKLD